MARMEPMARDEPAATSAGRRRLSGGVALAARVALACVGLAIFAVGIVLNLRANLGLAPWQALHYALTLHTPVTFGQASQVVGAVMLVVSWLCGVGPGLATLLNTALVGPFTDGLLLLDLIPAMEPDLGGVAMLLLSLVVSGLGIAAYIKAGLGAGPRDSFMLALMRLSGRGPAPVRIAIEVGATVVGWLLGAPIGVGTLLFAVGLGPAVGFWFKALGVRPTDRAGRRRHRR